MILLIATILLCVAAVVSAYYSARTARATEGFQSEVTEARKQMKVVVKHAQQTEASQARINDKLYRSVKEVEAAMADPGVQRALRVTETPGRGI